jgi:hypothetical protein
MGGESRDLHRRFLTLRICNDPNVSSHPILIRLMVAAWAFDRRILKDTQLRVFLNRAYLGDGGGREVIGFPTAARAFCGRPRDQLSDSEYYSLLAMLETPNRDHVLHSRS